MIDEDFEGFEEDDSEVLSEEEISKNINSYHSHKLCDIIIAYRYLGMFKSIYKLCMEELGKRRLQGDDFDFEGYIDLNLESMPKINFKVDDISDALKNIKI